MASLVPKQPAHDLFIVRKERGPATMLVNKAPVGKGACGLYVQNHQLVYELWAKPSGLVTPPYVLGSMHIDGCKGCGACYKAGRPCVFNTDEWNDIAPDILAADAIVFATPVYWFGWATQAKAALDRMFCFLPKGEEFRGKKCAFFSAAADGEDVFEAPLMVFEKSAALNGWEVIGEVCAARCGAHGAVRETDYLAMAAAVAERL